MAPALVAKRMADRTAKRMADQAKTLSVHRLQIRLQNQLQIRQENRLADLVANRMREAAQAMELARRTVQKRRAHTAEPRARRVRIATSH